MNDADFIDDALCLFPEDLARALLPDALRHRARLTLATLRELGRLPAPSLLATLADLPRHPLHLLDLEKPADQLTAETVLRLHPRPLRDHRAGKPVRPESLRAAADSLRAHASQALWEWILHATRQHARKAQPADSSLDPHTRQFSAHAAENRRAFRKLLRRYARSGDAAILAHPANLRWLASKPRLKKAVWIGTLELAFPPAKDGQLPLHLRPETRFEEILKMGTAVNSCLGLGGCNSHSAVANAADVNKRLLIATDPDGKFLARQLIALTEEDTLACFQPYHPDPDDPRLLRAFAAYNLHLARLLALPLHDPASEYTIARTVCRHWYDDGLWTPPEDPLPAATQTWLHPVPQGVFTQRNSCVNTP